MIAAGLTGLTRMPTWLAGLAGLTGMYARESRIDREFFLLEDLVDAVADVGQLDRPVARSEGNARGYQKRRNQRHRAECFFH